MSEVRRAAERLRRINAGNSVEEVYAQPYTLEHQVSQYDHPYHADLRLVLGQYLSEHPADSDEARPQWMDRPSGPGMWICMPDGKRVFQALTMELNAEDLNRGAPFCSPRVYGPIPKDTLKESKS